MADKLNMEVDMEKHEKLQCLSKQASKQARGI